MTLSIVVKSPDWCSINLGIQICIVCSGIHRSLGTDISKVRSIVLDDLDTEVLDLLVGLGNTRSRDSISSTGSKSIRPDTDS